MRKKIVCVLLVAVIAATLLLTLVACNGKGIYNGDFNLPEGSKPDLENRISSDDLDTLNAGIGGSGEILQEAIMKAYEIANGSRLIPNTSLMVQESIMGMNPGEKDEDFTVEDCALGTVLMHGFTLTTPDAFYNQFAAQLHTDNIIGQIAGMFSTMAKVSYKTEDGKYFFVQITDPALECDCDITRFPYASYKLIEAPVEYTYDEFVEATHVLNAPGEIYNMDFSAQLFDTETSWIEYDADAGVYKVHFEIDMSLDREILENWFRLPQEDMEISGQHIDNYIHYWCDMELWDNGYVKSYYADYTRNAGMASSITIDKFNYIYNVDEIFAIISDDYRLDEFLESDKEEQFATLNDYINYYINIETVKPSLTMFQIILIAVGCGVGALIILAIVLGILVSLRKHGHFPKWQARVDERKAAKRERLINKYGSGGSDIVVNDDDYDDFTA